MNKKLLIVSVALILLSPLPPLAGWVCMEFMPEFYLSRAVVKVDQTVNTGWWTCTPDLPEERISFPAEFEIIQSEIILRRVVEWLGLREGFALCAGADVLDDGQACRILATQYLRFRPYRDDGLIEITASARHFVEATDIANAVVEEYLKYREEKFRKRMGDLLAPFKKEIEAYEKNVETLRVQVDLAEKHTPEAIKAEHDWLQQQSILNLLKTRYQKNFTEMQHVTDRHAALLVTRALPNPRPIKPRRWLIMSVSVVLGLASLSAGVGLARKSRR